MSGKAQIGRELVRKSLSLKEICSWQRKCKETQQEGRYPRFTVGQMPSHLGKPASKGAKVLLGGADGSWNRAAEGFSVFRLVDGIARKFFGEFL
jgi:hypothetical protein